MILRKKTCWFKFSKSYKDIRENNQKMRKSFCLLKKIPDLFMPLLQEQFSSPYRVFFMHMHIAEK